MWLLRFHLIETRDYNRVERFCREIGFETKRYSSMILLKGVILHIFQKKSWRTVAKELNIPHLPVYNFYAHIQDSPEFREIIIYLIERRIILFFGAEKNITREYLETEEILSWSLEELERIF